MNKFVEARRLAQSLARAVRLVRAHLHKIYDQHSYASEKRRALDLWPARAMLESDEA